MLAEESAPDVFAQRRSWSTFWLVDPLDGTREFVERNGEFTVNIALVENSEPVLGVVCARRAPCSMVQRAAVALSAAIPTAVAGRSMSALRRPRRCASSAADPTPTP